MGHPLWPLFDLEVRTPRLTLRYLDDALATELATLAGRGIHDPATMPFYQPWTDAPPGDLERGALQFYWRCRAETTAVDWRLNLAVVVDGTVVGTADLFADQFPVLRSFETGSWLGRAHQGQGLGKELRIAALHLGFVGFGAAFATTGAFVDNGASLGVTRSLGYTLEGHRRAVRRGEPAEIAGFRMSREHFDHHVRRDDVTFVGLDEVRRFLAIPAAG